MLVNTADQGHAPDIAGSPPPFDLPDGMDDAANRSLPTHGGFLAAIRAAIRHHRRWAIATLLVVLAGALIVYALLPRRFTATADLWLDHRFERMGAAPSPAAAASNSPLARNTELRLLTSTDLAAAAVDRLGLANVRGVGQPRTGTLVPRDIARRQAIETIRDSLAVETNGGSYAVATRYTAADPVLATGILNNLIEGYVADRRSGGERARERAAMQAQVAAAREAAVRGQATAGGYREALGTIAAKRGRGTINGEIAALDAAVRTAGQEKITADAALRWARSGAGTRADTPGATPPDAAAEARRMALLTRAASAAQGRIVVLRAARTRAGEELRAVDAANAQLRRIGDQAAAAQARYADFARRYQALIIEQRNNPGTAYIISRGFAPAARRYPDPMLFLLGGLLGALVAAGAVVLLLELLTKGFRTPQQLERAIGQPVIGTVPDLDKVRDADFPPDDRMGPPDYLYNHRHSAFSAAFRNIHAGLKLGPTGTRLRSVAICSALPEEGKTTVALCLARSAALSGLRVVLVDCDARRPAASRALSPFVRTGLAEVLEDGVDFRDALEADTPSGAWFLAQGSDRPVANGTFSITRMTALIRQLERSYDLVLLDLPPALALSEARELAAVADGVLLVARARKTPVEATGMAKELLDKAGARVIAAALTMVDP